MFVKINSGLLNKSINKAGIGEKVAAQSVLSLFHKRSIAILGKEKARQARPMYLRNKRLVVQVENSIVAAEIKKHEKEILSYLCEQSAADVKGLVFVS